MAKSKSKIQLHFPGFEEYAEKLDKLGGDLKKVTEKALKESHAYVTPNLHADMEKHNRTGDTDESILDDSKVEWSGTTASIDVGFDIANGGFASIFLMKGTPKMDKDQQLFNDIYGSKTKKEIGKIQEEIFAKAIKERMGG